MRKSFAVITGMFLTTMMLFGASRADASTEPPFAPMTPNTHIFPFKVASVTPSVTVNGTKGIVVTKYQNSTKAEWIVEFATNSNSRLDPIPAGYGEHVSLNRHVPAVYFNDGHVQRLQFTRNGVYYLLFAAKGRFHGWMGTTVRSYKPLTTKQGLTSIANSMTPRK